MTRKELKDMWIKNMEINEKSEGTIKEYIKHLDCFFDFIGDKELKNVVKFDVNMFRSENSNLSKSYKNSKLSAVKSFFDFLVNDIEYLDKNVTLGIKPYTIKEQDVDEKIPLTKLQEKELLNHCKNIRDKAVIESLLELGLRISELINITKNDYEFAKKNDGELHIIGKGDKYRVVFINNNLFKTIDKYLLVRKDSEYDNLFISNGCKPLDRSCVSRTLKTIAKRSNAFTDSEIEKLHSHLLRHTFVTDTIERGVEVAIVSKIVGHSDINTTLRIYNHIGNDNIKKAMKGI